MESYAKKLIDRFWEERRLTYPHITVLYDVIRELCEITDTIQTEKDGWEIELQRLQHIRILDSTGNVLGSLVIETAEDLIMRNTTESLDTPLSTNSTDCILQELLYGARIWIRDITRLCSKIATRYYLDVPMNKGTRSSYIMEKI